MLRGRIDIVVEDDRKILEALAKSLEPETKTSPSKRGRAKVRFRGGKMFLTIKANSTAALRAIFNSYISWVSAILNVIEEVETLGGEDPSRSAE